MFVPLAPATCGVWLQHDGKEHTSS